MKCLLLAAGLSTRLAALGGGAPKPLMPVAGVPVLHRNLRWLRAHGIAETFINLHHRGAEIKESIGDGSAFGVKVSWSEENPILGTAGAAKKLAAELSAGEDFLVVYGDNVFGFDLGAMLAAHRQARRESLGTGGARRTLAVPLAGTLAVFDAARNLNTGIAGGRVATDAGQRVTGFVEGPLTLPSPHGGEGNNPLTLAGGPGNSLVNAACYVLERGVLACIPDPPRASDWARDIFPALLAAGQILRAHLLEEDGYCLGIDTPAAYETAERLFREGHCG